MMQVFDVLAPPAPSLAPEVGSSLPVWVIALVVVAVIGSLALVAIAGPIIGRRLMPQTIRVAPLHKPAPIVDSEIRQARARQLDESIQRPARPPREEELAEGYLDPAVEVRVIFVSMFPRASRSREPSGGQAIFLTSPVSLTYVLTGEDTGQRGKSYSGGHTTT